MMHICVILACIMKAALQRPVPTGPAQDLFHHHPDQPGFESLAHNDGFKFWWDAAMSLRLGTRENGGNRGEARLLRRILDERRIVIPP
jgi:hypothetical protein